LPGGLSEKEREYIVLHEQTHIRRRDYIVKFAAYFIICLHWFNPLAWVAFILMGVDMEMSCDERVLREMSGDTKKDYSLSLLSLATERRFVSGSPLAFGEGGVKERIKRVLNFKKPSRVIIIAAIALAMVLIAGFAVNRISGDNPSYSEIAELINATQEEVYQKLGNPQETLNGTDIFIINGKTILMTYDENLRVNQINYNGESVVNTPGSDDYVVWSQLSVDDVRALAEKGEALQASDLPNLRPSLLSSTMGGYNPTLYGVEGGYRLLVNFNNTTNPESGIRSIQLESIWQNGGSGIDIRYNDVDEFIRMNPSHPADTVPSTTFQPRKWIDRENNEFSLTTTYDLMLDEFPGVIFSYTPERLIATNDNGEKELFGGTDGFIFGGYIDSVFLADLNGDGKPEFCSYTNWGSGFGDLRVIVYDYQNDNRFVLSDRGTYDYFLQMELGRLEIVQTSPMQMNDTLGIGRLAIIDGELVVFGIDRTQPITDPQPEIPPTYVSSWRPLDVLPTDFSMEQALEMGNIVVIGYDGTYNQHLIDGFYRYVASGAAAFMRVVQQTIEGDVIITDFQYDGDVFIVTHDSTRDRFSAIEDRRITTLTFKYLVPFNRPQSDSTPSTASDAPAVFYLSNEENIYTTNPDGRMMLIEDLWWIPPPSDSYVTE
ncbi:MAG: DUF4362 domain-containing protein, partial [Oscillospiraceae bacterium]|nr:DUF4362 domain-containing protein [Oscillospiraceae bacterium]